MALAPIQPAPWRSALNSARAHLRAGIFLQAMALILVLAYYHVPPARAFLDRLLEIRRETGFAFGIVSTAVFGGLLPFLYLRSLGAEAGAGPRYRWPQGFALIAFWGYKGFEIDLFYRVLARIVGEGHDAGTIARKVLIDQFVYCPAFAVPLTVGVYRWVDARFDLVSAVSDWRAPHWYLRRVLPVMISNLGVWVPAVAIIYALPTPLQLPLENLVLCFFTLVLAHQTRGQAAPSAS